MKKCIIESNFHSFLAIFPDLLPLSPSFLLCWQKDLSLATKSQITSIVNDFYPLFKEKPGFDYNIFPMHTVQHCKLIMLDLADARVFSGLNGI